MDLDVRQTRVMFLAGTVAFPTPYLSVGTISFETGQLKYAEGEHGHSREWVVVQQPPIAILSNFRATLQENVSAIFVPGIWESTDKFQISRQAKVSDTELGEWFVDSDVCAESIRSRLKLLPSDDITTRASSLRGIVFVRQRAPVVSISVMTDIAAAISNIPIAIPTTTVEICWCRPPG